MQISLFAYSNIWQSTILHQNVMLYSIILCVKMVSIDEKICCNYHMKNPQKSVLVIICTLEVENLGFYTYTCLLQVYTI